MARNITVNGVAYPVPTAGDVDWAKNLTDFHQALADGLTTAGGQVVNPHAAPYSAVGDGVTDDSGALQAAIDAAAESKLPLVLDSKTYLINTELVLDGETTVEIRGRGNNSQLIAGAGIRSVLALTGGAQGRFYDVFFHGGRLAQHCVFLSDASGTYFDNCDFYEGLIDGLHLDFNCDRIRTSNCRFQLNGVCYHTAGYAGSCPAIIRTSVAGTTVQIAAGQIVFGTQLGNFTVGETITGGTSGATAVIVGQYDAGTTGKLALSTVVGTFQAAETITGGTSAATAVVTSYSVGTNSIVGTGTTFTGKEVRAGDWISVHATAPGDSSATWLQVSEVDSATFISCCLHPQAAATASGQQYSLHVGDGLHEGPGRADNNIGVHVAPLFRNNAGCGYMIHGLYGPLVLKPQSDANGAWPICISYVNLATIGTQILGEYYELNNAGDYHYNGCSADIIVLGSNTAGAPGVSNGSFNWGVILGRQNAGDEGRIDPIGSAPIDYVPSGVIADSAWAKGKIYGLSYAQNAVSTRSYQQMKDSQAAVLQQEISTENGGADTNAVGRKLNVYSWRNGASAQALQESANRYLDAIYNNGTLKRGVSAEGVPCVPSDDTSGTPGDCQIDKPSGRFALAAGAASVVVTNNLVRASGATAVFVQKQGLDATATDFSVVPDALGGSFTVAPNALSTGTVIFRFWLKHDL